MTIQELIQQLITYDALKPVIPYLLLAMLIDTYFRKNGIYPVLLKLLRNLYTLCSLLKNQLSIELKEHFKDVAPPSEKVQAVVSWFLVLTDVLFSSWMILYGTCIILLLTLNQPSTGKLFLGMSFAICFFFIGSFYRAGAYKTAKKHGLDITPWKTKKLSTL